MANEEINVEEELDEEDTDNEEKESKTTDGSDKSKKNSVKPLPKVEELDPQVRFVLKKIEEYLTNEAKKDELFAKKYPNETKSIVQCWIYICDQVSKNKNNFVGGAVHSSYMFRCARDFYNDDLKASGQVANGKLMTENEQEDNEFDLSLTEADKKAIRDKEIRSYEEKVKNKIYEKAQKQEKAEIKAKGQETNKLSTEKEKLIDEPKKCIKKKIEKKPMYEKVSLFDF